MYLVITQPMRVKWVTYMQFLAARSLCTTLCSVRYSIPLAIWRHMSINLFWAVQTCKYALITWFPQISAHHGASFVSQIECTREVLKSTPSIAICLWVMEFCNYYKVVLHRWTYSHSQCSHIPLATPCTFIVTCHCSECCVLSCRMWLWSLAAPLYIIVCPVVCFKGIESF